MTLTIANFVQSGEPESGSWLCQKLDVAMDRFQIEQTNYRETAFIKIDGNFCYSSEGDLAFPL
jgi:hypothetical protein